MEGRGAHGGEAPAGWIGLPEEVESPASEGAIGLHPAGVADGGESPAGWAGLPVVVVPPAGEGAIGLHPAGVADGGEGPVWWARLPVAIKSPAGEGTVGFHPTGVPAPGADGGEGAAGWPGRPKRFSPQQARMPSVLTPQVYVSPALTAVKVPRGGLVSCQRYTGRDICSKADQ